MVVIVVKLYQLYAGTYNEGRFARHECWRKRRTLVKMGVSSSRRLLSLSTAATVSSKWMRGTADVDYAVSQDINNSKLQDRSVLVSLILKIGYNA